MRKRARSYYELKSMSEYGSSWLALVVMQASFIGFYWLLLFMLDINNLSLVNELKFLRSLNPIEDPWRYFSVAGIVLYFYVIMSALNILLYKILDVESILKHFTMFKSRNLGLWFLSSISFLGWAAISEVFAFTDVAVAVVAVMIMVVSFFFFYRYILKLKAYYKFPAIVISIGTYINCMSIGIKENELGLFPSTILLFMKGFFWMFLAHFFIIYALAIISMIISSATNEYRSAQLGKEMQFRRLMVSGFRDYFMKYGYLVKENLSGKLLLSRQVQDFLKEIISIRGLTFHEKLTLMKEMVQTDVSEHFSSLKARYLQFRNTINVWVSMVYLFNIIIILLFVLPYIERKEDALHILLIMITIRLFQRMIEIGWAFYQDITSAKPKSSTLTGSDRLILAVKSIFEMMITSALFYFLFDSLGQLEAVRPFQEGYAQYARETLERLLKTVVESISVSFFNVSLPLGYHDSFTFKTVVHLFQVGISIILITLSIANYLNMKKNAYQYSVIREEDAYAAYYYLQLTGEKQHKREIARGASKEELRQIAKVMWQDQRIDDSEFASLIACLDDSLYDSESGQAELEKLRNMSFQQLSDYVRKMLRDNPQKSNKSIKLVDIKDV